MWHFWFFLSSFWSKIQKIGNEEGNDGVFLKVKVGKRREDEDEDVVGMIDDKDEDKDWNEN